MPYDDKGRWDWNGNYNKEGNFTDKYLREHGITEYTLKLAERNQKQYAEYSEAYSREARHEGTHTELTPMGKKEITDYLENGVTPEWIVHHVKEQASFMNADVKVFEKTGHTYRGHSEYRGSGADYLGYSMKEWQNMNPYEKIRAQKDWLTSKGVENHGIYEESQLSDMVDDVENGLYDNEYEEYE